MNIVTVMVGKALICFAGQCHPALVGPDTPTGRFEMVRRHVVAPGYGGTVIQFKETDDIVYAIHRPYALDRKINRKSALRSTNPEYRRLITKGCVNVTDEVFETLFSGIWSGEYQMVEIVE